MRASVFLWVLCSLWGLAACSGNNGDRPAPQPANTVSSQPFSSSAQTASSQNAQVTLSGRLTYDQVSPSVSGTPATVKLDYAQAVASPIRGATVELLDSLNIPLQTTRSDEQGQYRFTVELNRAVKIRVKAELLASGRYSIAIKNNLMNNIQYVLDGNLAGSGSSGAQTRDLHANLGWDNSLNDYAQERQAAPFAILDALYDSLQLVLTAKPSVALPHLDVFWSPGNIASSGDFSQGQIGSSLYSRGASAIYLLGSANNDTDEFDYSVIQHEFGHFIEDTLSRSDSIGGPHMVGIPVDMRLAFSEGFGNSFAGMSRNTSLYLDTYGAAQSRGFGFNLERNTFGGGHYSEGAVQAILYDLFDNASDTDDTLSLGFAPILDALTTEDLLRFEGASSIHTFAASFKKRYPEHAAGLNTLLLGQKITGIDAYATDETATGGTSFSLPVYHRLTEGAAVTVCSSNNIQEYNGHEVNRFVFVTIPVAGSYQISAQRQSGISNSNPELTLFRRGAWLTAVRGPTANTTNLRRNFEADTYLLVVQESANSDDVTSTGGLVCFNLTLNRL